MRNFWLDAFINPKDYDGCTWNAQVMDAAFNEVEIIDSHLDQGETEEELILSFSLNEQAEDFTIDELVDHLEDSVEATFDAYKNGNINQMHLLFLWSSEVTLEPSKNDTKVIWRFKHRCLFSGIW